ncbi:class I SAM-dependent methyltransferase [Candidatus Poribacteria bacterium]|nr:class I SAM-dependent methyltransferase [Candidatus Poribacteria bacterium]
MSIACGHLREALLSKAAQNRALGRYVALDQGPLTIETVKQQLSDIGVEAYICSIRKLFGSRRDELGKFDFIYSSGLFDYLADSTGSRLLEVIFQMLNPGGKVCITNFVPGIYTAGYMEAIMDWWLIFRDEQAMQQLTSRIPRSQIAQQRIFHEDNQNVLFLEIEKVG